MMQEKIHYAISVYYWVGPAQGQSGYWSSSGFMPGGNTIDEAYARIKKEIKRYADLSTVKFKITKVVTIESTEDEFTGEDLTALVLKHR